MSHIKSKGWANGLSAGAYPVCHGSPGIFNVQIRLTEEVRSTNYLKSCSFIVANPVHRASNTIVKLSRYSSST